MLWVGHFEQLTGLWTDEGFDSYFAVYISLSCGGYSAPYVDSYLGLFAFCTCCILRFLVCIVVSCLVCIVVVVLCVLL